MSLSIAVAIQQDPRKSGRAVEALRIALGLATGDNPLTVVLLDEAPRLLSDDVDDVVDVEILEKHHPVLKELAIPFLVQTGAREQFSIDPDFAVRETSYSDLVSVITAADRVLTF